MILGTIVLVLTALWHALATWHFMVTPTRTLGRTTHERPISPVATELFRFLGAMNIGFIVLALLAASAFPEGRRLAYVVLVVANASQAIVDARVQRLGLARGSMFKQIFLGDVVFTLANALAFALEPHG